jgi:hypothetical protein
MATSTMVPYSNPAGNNQTSPPGLNQGNNGAVAVPVVAGAPGSTAANPFVPITPGQVTGGSAPVVGAPGGVVPTNTSESGGNTYAQGSNPGGFITNNLSNTNGQNNLYNQLTDIYGQGTGASLFSLLSNMSGTNSTTLQEYINSLAPQEATGQANINASLGAAGVSANSSVAGIADANLQSQEFANISAESANLTQSQEDLTAQILEGTEGAATKEVGTTPLSIFGDVLGQVGGDASTLFSGGIPSLGSGGNFAQSAGVLSGAQSYSTVPGTMDTDSSAGENLFL